MWGKLVVFVTMQISKGGSIVGMQLHRFRSISMASADAIWSSVALSSCLGVASSRCYWQIAVFSSGRFIENSIFLLHREGNRGGIGKCVFCVGTRSEIRMCVSPDGIRYPASGYGHVYIRGRRLLHHFIWFVTPGRLRRCQYAPRCRYSRRCPHHLGRFSLGSSARAFVSLRTV